MDAPWPRAGELIRRRDVLPHSGQSISLSPALIGRITSTPWPLSQRNSYVGMRASLCRRRAQATPIECDSEHIELAWGMLDATDASS